MIRVILAGLFVFAGLMLSVTAVFGLMPDAPLSVLVPAIVIALFALILLALVLFNRNISKSPFQDREEYIRDLETKGLLVSSEFRATRAFEIEEGEDEGSHYFIELEDGGVLFMSGQYLYEYEALEEGEIRRFPCTGFTVRRHKTEGYVIDLQPRGRVLEPELTAPPFSGEDFGDPRMPEDGKIYRDRTYDEIKAAKTRKGVS